MAIVASCLMSYLLNNVDNTNDDVCEERGRLFRSPMTDFYKLKGVCKDPIGNCARLQIILKKKIIMKSEVKEEKNDGKLKC